MFKTQPSDDDPPAPRGPPPPSFGPRGGLPPLPGTVGETVNFILPVSISCMHTCNLMLYFGFKRIIVLSHFCRNSKFFNMNIEHAGRSGPPPSSRGGGPPLPGGDGVVTLDSWRKSQVLLLDIVQGVCKEANVAKKRKKRNKT